MITMTDLFCGAGGSSTGAAQAGVEVRLAANHWQLAVETHNTNHPGTDHDCADLSQVDPRRYPRTDLLWASPECTNHSQAKGVRRADRQPDLFEEVLPSDAAVRSRATMWDVLRFAEHHAYSGIVVENVVEARDWVMWPAWSLGLATLGYDHEVIYLNSMHARAAGDPAPQSRDRLYVVAWKRGNTRPDLDRWTRPTATCPACTQTRRAVQAWKNPTRRHGRYKTQYVWRCPVARCHAEVFPETLPAATAIDWTIPGQRIGDRTRPLAPKTIVRIRAGLDRFPHEPSIITLRNHNTPKPVATTPLDTMAAAGQHHGILTGPGWVNPHQYAYDTGAIAPVTVPVPTQTTVVGDAIIDPAPDIDDCLFRMLDPAEIARAMAFPAGYRILGTRREQVRQAGNAVTPPSARDLVSAVREALS